MEKEIIKGHIDKVINELNWVKDEVMQHECDEEPDRPPRSEIIEPPEIIELDYPVKTHGQYKRPNGKPLGLIVHFTAGWSGLESGYRNGVEGAAKSTLRYLANSGLGCLVMSADGIIYKAKSQDWNDVAWHAGSSSYEGLNGLSRYCMGMEICNAGLLSTSGNSWFSQAYPESMCRKVEARDCAHAGIYQKFTEEQEKALIQFCLWQKKVNSEFNFDWVLGHSEIAIPRGRKSDPGGSLSMSMPEFRELLKKEWENINT